MQPINIETIIILVFVIIITTLVYRYFKNKSEDKKENILTEKNSMVSATEENKHELPAITAIIAMLMEQRPFKIKNIVIGKGEEISTWRLFGRQEIMRKRANLQR
jgi:Na+-transporting methylmalonyl-CoA/oxaloacetate decarboxylase gamma subunit